MSIVEGRIPSAELISVIRVVSVAGAGTPENPGRQVLDYYAIDGEHLAHVDKWAEEPK